MRGGNPAARGDVVQSGAAITPKEESPFLSDPSVFFCEFIVCGKEHVRERAG